jgi:hypothetical protein
VSGPEAIAGIAATKCDLQKNAFKYAVEDKGPWYDGDELVVLDKTAAKQRQWSFPRTDGVEIQTAFEASQTGRCDRVGTSVCTLDTLRMFFLFPDQCHFLPWSLLWPQGPCQVSQFEFPDFWLRPRG